MNLLVLGGTQFVGRHIVAEAQARGHTVTLFNRGTHKDVFPGLEQLIGDRNEDLSALDGRSWDAVIDTCGYVPRQLELATRALKNSVGRYIFISTISVYADLSKPDTDEDAPLASLDDPTTEEVTGETYGGLKVLCEKVVREAFPNRQIILRPGIVAGPYDPTDRFTYWPERVARGGDMLAPGRADAPLQFIDARDLAVFTLDTLSAKATGTYNIVAPAGSFTFGELLETSRQVSHADTRATWVSDDFLKAQGFELGASELPFWTPPVADARQLVSSAKAVTAGLEIRPLADTVRDTLAWNETRPRETERKAGLTPEREAELLQAWHDARAAQGALR